MLDFTPRSIRNVAQDPITQHTDQRAKPKVYESLIKPMPVNVQLQGTLPPYDVDRIWGRLIGHLQKMWIKRENPYSSIFQIIRYLELTYLKQQN